MPNVNTDPNEAAVYTHTNISPRYIWYILAAALTLRSLLPISGYLFTHDISIFSAPDTSSYLEPARRLISTGTFSTATGVPEVIRTPGYPLLLLPGILLNHPDLVTLILQILISCFTVYLVYSTSSLIFSSGQAACLSAALYAVEPLSILYSSILISETLFAALLLLSLYYFIRYLHCYDLGPLLASAAAFAASAYVRPIGYFLPAALAISLIAWSTISGHHYRPFVIHLSLFLFLFFLLTGVWQVRNDIETDYSGFSGIAPINLYFYDAAAVLAVQRHVPWTQMQKRLGYEDDRLYLERHPEQRTWPLGRRLNYMDHEAVVVLLNNPFSFAKLQLEGIVRALLDPGATYFLKFFDLYQRRGGLLGSLVDHGIINTTAELLFDRPLVFWSNALLFVPLFIIWFCASISLCSKALLRDPAFISIIIVVGYCILISGGPAALGRFRHPVMPMVCIMAGYGLFTLGRTAQIRIPRLRSNI